MRELETKTGVNRETIRVYLREGLLPDPKRPARNVADYDEDHVRAILAVRRLQREAGMTLPEIKATLNGQGNHLSIGASAFAHLEDLVAARIGVPQGLVPLESLLERNVKALVDAQALARIGLIDLVETPAGTMLTITDAGLVNIWGGMRKVGFDEDHGFPPEILDYYVGAAEYVASNEARLFLERVEGRIAEDEAAAMLEFALPAMLDFFGIIRQRAFLRFIGDKTRTGAEIPAKPLGGEARPL